MARTRDRCSYVINNNVGGAFSLRLKTVTANPAVGVEHDKIPIMVI